MANIIASAADWSTETSYALEILGSPTVLCLFGCRMLIHLKDIGDRDANGGTSIQQATLSNMEFN